MKAIRFSVSSMMRTGESMGFSSSEHLPYKIRIGWRKTYVIPSMGKRQQILPHKMAFRSLPRPESEDWANNVTLLFSC